MPSPLPVVSPQSLLNRQHANPEHSKQDTHTHNSPSQRRSFALFGQENSRQLSDSNLVDRQAEESLQLQQTNQAARNEAQARRAILRYQERINQPTPEPQPTFIEPRVVAREVPSTFSRAKSEKKVKAQAPLPYREHSQHKQLEQLRQQQSQRKVKNEISIHSRVVNKFINKIADRFPGRPHLAKQFAAMMDSQIPARELYPEVADMFRTAPEIAADFREFMDVFDRGRVQQSQQSQQQPQASQSQGLLSQSLAIRSQVHPGNAAYGDDNSEDTRVRDLQQLLSLPAIDIAPGQRKNTPAGLSCDLMEHQKVGLTWLIQQEEDAHKKGGILADTMGLGKTIQALALILSRPSRDEARKTTLIVAPLALLTQWEQEINTKVKPSHKLKTCIYHGDKKKTLKLSDLLLHDVVLTTYMTITLEHKNLGKKNLKPKILSNNAMFYRVILDEAHSIKNRRSKGCIAVAGIKATHRLCMTGTPFMNKAEEIYPLIHFLQIKPYNEWPKFNEHIIKPLNKQDSDECGPAMRKLQALFRSITLRRAKTSRLDGEPILRLPPLTRNETAAKLDHDQREFYDALEQRQKLKANQFLKRGAPMKKYTYILTLLLRLRQACCHPHLIRDFGIPDGVQISPEDMYKLAKKLNKKVIDKLKTDTEFDCPMCDESTDNPVILYPCGHRICCDCFTASTEDNESGAQYPCPHANCQSTIDPEKVICHCFFLEAHMPEKVKSEDSDSDDSEDDDDGYESLPDDDDADARGNLKGFVVSDNEDEIQEEDEDEESDPSAVDINDELTPGEDQKSEPLSESNNVSWKDIFGMGETAEEKSADKSTDDSDDDSLPSVGRIWKNRQEVMDIDNNRPKKIKKRQMTPDSISDDETLEKKVSSAKGKRKRVSYGNSPVPVKKRKTGKNGVKQEKGKKKKFLSLAALKAMSSTNAKAKAKYMKRLRKDWVPSAKTDKTIELLSAIREKNPGEKTLVFSLWTSFLDLLEIPMQDNGFQYTRYDGSMRPEDRTAAVKSFMEDDDIQIMLVSLSAGNAGLNLTAASQVIILEPFWNPFVEDQAIDRAHRIGQDKDVTVHHVLVEGTVEDRICELQAKKRKLVNMALSEEGAQGVGRLSASELRGLFGLN